MKIWYGLFVVLMVVVLTAMSGCAGDQKITEDEAITIVRQSEFIYPRWSGEWSASYKGKGHWVVTACWDSDCWSWDYYEDSGIINKR